MLILLEEPNVLILDAPGNDLDVDMLAAVEDLLDGWPGTLLLVTHDRYLMERVTDNQYALIDGHVRHLPGGVDEYIEIMGERVPASGEARSAAASPAQPAVGAGMSNQELRALKKTLQSTERKMKTLESKIADAQTRLHDADPTDFVALGEIQAEIDSLQEQLDELEVVWLETADALS